MKSALRRFEPVADQCPSSPPDGLVPIYRLAVPRDTGLAASRFAVGGVLLSHR
jgi:hypothetical protein